MLSTDVFIERARAIHGEKYDYSQSAYTRNDQPLTIICPVHGAFQQTPLVHWRGSGCPECANLTKSNNQQYTQEDFLRQANEKHNGLYDYSQINWTNWTTKITIICPVHGAVQQLPRQHIDKGCSKCARPSRITYTTEQYIERAKLVHGDTYDYSLTRYCGSTAKIDVICQQHGVFAINASHHLAGYGCPICKNHHPTARPKSNILTPKEIFIQKAQAVHNNAFIYDDINYTTMNQAITLKCAIHGVFTILPYTHLKGHHCPTCEWNTKWNNFLQEAYNVHGDTYQYSTQYTNSLDKIAVICPIHGMFTQSAYKHLHGEGCDKCARTQKAYTQAEWIEKARQIHGEQYNYDKVSYNGSLHPVIIQCKEHGDFSLLPTTHLQGAGCPRCVASAGERLVEYVLRTLNCQYQTEYKFPECKDKLPLPFDFMLFRGDKIIGEIEYHGRQHYEPVTFGDMSEESALERLKYTQHHDRIKTDFLIAQSIPQLVIPYTQHSQTAALVEKFIQSL